MKLRFLLAVLCLSVVMVKSFLSQEEKTNVIQKPLGMVNVLSWTANANFGVAKAKFTKGGDWKHPFGYSITAGVGISYMIRNSVGFEANFSYELNSYLFNNKNVNLSLGYRAPYVDLKIKKVFSPDAEDSFYGKLGAGYMFGGAGGVGKTEDSYSYTINFESRSIFLVMGEIGFQKRNSKKNYQDFGVVFRYGLKDIISSTMVYNDNVTPSNSQFSSSITAGTYIGITYKYYVIFKETSKKLKETRKAPDERF